MKKILVTGGAGFVGSHTCLVLLENGYEIIIYDSFANSNRKSLDRIIDILNLKIKYRKPKIQIIKGDIRDEIKLNALFLESKESGMPIEAVIHFAGLKSVEQSVFNPLLYWDVNVNGSLKLFEVMNRYNCRTIIFSSSATIYDVKNDKPLSEDSEIKPINPYGKTKASIEQILNDIYCSCSSKWRIANLRYFNPIGAHPSGLIGEAPIGKPSNIFPYITQVATGNLDRLKIFGNDWPTVDGTGVRDYIHVMDIAEGHIAAMEYLQNGKPKIINLNLGTGLGTSVLELINIFQRVNSLEIPYEISSRRKGDLAHVVADNSLAISCLKWSPKRSIEQMCIDGWKWQSLNSCGY